MTVRFQRGWVFVNFTLWTKANTEAFTQLNFDLAEYHTLQVMQLNVKVLSHAIEIGNVT